MKSEKIFFGDNEWLDQEQAVSGEFRDLENETYYCIRNYDRMPPFFMTIVSDSDHWMFISSKGGLTAGRINPDSALFPYYTDDKIHDTSDITGSKSVFLVRRNEKTYLWEPFASPFQNIYRTSRNLYKNRIGNKIVFEEINHDLGMSFRYGWMNSERFGWIRKSSLENIGEEKISVRLLDGLQNILPYGITQNPQAAMSTLMDGYKKSERLQDVAMGIFRLSSIPVDRAEPSEALKANTVWTTGLPVKQLLLSIRQLENFRIGEAMIKESGSKGEKGAFFINSELSLDPRQKQTWYIVAEVNQDASAILALQKQMLENGSLIESIEDDVAKGSSKLEALVYEADGKQESHDMLQDTRHFANILFNIMRGGIFHNAYTIDSKDFRKHIASFNKKCFIEHKAFLNSLPEKISYQSLVSESLKSKDQNLIRLTYEYLPITFSRRHGDPSRPWNRFSIDIKDEYGGKLLAYQGNWRDIFQNWEALGHSYPLYFKGMIAKFLNASTADGYNPYRVTRNGIDWEIEDLDDPWSYIGYWGDHQIIYLQKLLEQLENYYPGELLQILEKEWFSYANVPYRIKAYRDIIEDPQNTILFDEKLNENIEMLAEKTGADGKLLHDSDGNILLVNLLEKLLLTLLTKMSNFVPEAGIWLNTQRPEWNDANNALVGNGASMVTVYYLRRYVKFLHSILRDENSSHFSLSSEVLEFFQAIFSSLSEHKEYLGSGFNDKQRKHFTDHVGEAGSQYREKVYAGFSSEKSRISNSDLLAFLELSLQFIDQSIASNKREDKLYQAYNLVSFSTNEISIRYLQKMLEGQVAILSAGKLDPEGTLEVLDALRSSDLYREDQDSYVLYPDKNLPDFLEKNNITQSELKQIPLLKTIVETGDDTILKKDHLGNYHFNGLFRNSGDLSEALAKLSGTLSFSDHESNEAIRFFETKFDHQSFTGRSGTFYKYEGLGSIYWHMVSKILLAVGENLVWAIEQKAHSDILQKLETHYHDIKEGIGVHKNPAVYGAFPTDPYSHTPSMMGAQQPGMTGQVKEDILSRLIELGITIKKGTIQINPELVKNLVLEESKDAFLNTTFCSTPISFRNGSDNRIKIVMNDGSSWIQNDMIIPEDLSRELFQRDTNISKVIIDIK